MSLVKSVISLSFAVLLWFCTVKHFNRVDYQLETERAFDGAKLQLWSNGIHCDGS